MKHKDLVLERIKKGGGLEPLVPGLFGEQQEKAQEVLNKKWLKKYNKK